MRWLLLLFALLVAFAIAPSGARAQQGLWSSIAGPTPTPAPTPTGTIKHIVIVIQENRSVDNLFAGLSVPGAHTTTTVAGSSCGATVLTAYPHLGDEPWDLNHNHSGFVNVFDGGANDGWGCGTGGTQAPVYYVQDNHVGCTPGSTCTNVSRYQTMALQFTLADEVKQTNEGPSTAAHHYLVAGQCGVPISCANQFGSCAGGGSGNTVDLRTSYPGTPLGSESACVDYDTIWDDMTLSHFNSTYYAPTSVSNFWFPQTQLTRFCVLVSGNCTYTTVGNASIVHPETQVVTDLTNGTLSCALCYVAPSAAESDHANEGTNGAGPTYVASIVNAWGGNATYFHNTVVIVVWDDWGGWYDHVVPTHPTNGSGTLSPGGNTDPYEFGYRVPLLFMSAYNNSPGTPYHTVTDSAGGILAYVETTFGLGCTPQCTGTLRANGGYYHAGDCTIGMGQRDCYAADNLTAIYNTANSPATFTMVYMPWQERVVGAAVASDNGASLLNSIDPNERLLGVEALAYAHTKGWDTLAWRSRPVDADGQ